ncbi:MULTISPECIES: nucleoside hydrolase [unclassified Brachybacterium]|uniref:nucleoside hydrolase n=1 Tax=unclassified Brachybacterium TaxID=2623841 RepID=UPI0036133F1B
MTRIPPRPAEPAERRWRLGETPWQSLSTPVGTRPRVLIDNDFSGDPDDLHQLVHHLLSPTVDIRAVIGSHLREGDPFDPGPHSARNATAVAHDVLSRMGLDAHDIVHEGSNHPLPDLRTPSPSPAADAIIAEALREDTDAPLFYAAGGGLTDLASALLLRPEIAARMTLIWIGGAEHPDLAVPPPDAMPIEYNLQVDLAAAQTVFETQELTIWQVARDTYRQCLVSDAELRLHVATTGSLGQYLYEETREVVEQVAGRGRGGTGTYVLGDSPLVLLTALQSLFEPDPSSSSYVRRPTPGITEDGTYHARAGSRPMRVYTRVDTRLMVDDYFLKLREFDSWQALA